jgi:predicted ATP-grasp superfamily ATP-dependent carboligase
MAFVGKASCFYYLVNKAMSHSSVLPKGKKERRRTLNYFPPPRSISQYYLPSATRPVHLDARVALLAMAQKLNRD